MRAVMPPANTPARRPKTTTAAADFAMGDRHGLALEISFDERRYAARPEEER
jgi:hypothetical protein